MPGSQSEFSLQICNPVIDLIYRVDNFGDSKVAAHINRSCTTLVCGKKPPTIANSPVAFMKRD